MLLSDSALYIPRSLHVLLYLLSLVTLINRHHVAGEAKGKLEKKINKIHVSAA